MQQNEFLLYSHLPYPFSTKSVKLACTTIFHPAPASVTHLKYLHFMSLNEGSITIPKSNSAIAQKAEIYAMYFLENGHISLVISNEDCRNWHEI
jgi:hypothetical protein